MMNVGSMVMCSRNEIKFSGKSLVVFLIGFTRLESPTQAPRSRNTNRQVMDSLLLRLSLLGFMSSLGKNLSGYRETNTMPQWAGSCWYYLRFMDPTNSDAIVDPAVVKYWGEVDSYIGGAEHAVLHLLYARFWHKFLFDIGVVPSDEPFFRLRNVGLILWPDGNKMSKSKAMSSILMTSSQNTVPTRSVSTRWVWLISLMLHPGIPRLLLGATDSLEKIYRLFTADIQTPEYKSWTAKDDLAAIKMMHKTIKKGWWRYRKYEIQYCHRSYQHHGQRRYTCRPRTCSRMEISTHSTPTSICASYGRRVLVTYGIEGSIYSAECQNTSQQWR